MDLDDIVKWGVIVGLTAGTLLTAQKARGEPIVYQQEHTCSIQYNSAKYTEMTMILDNGHVLKNYLSADIPFGFFDGRNLMFDNNNDGVIDFYKMTLNPNHQIICDNNPNYKKI